MFRLKTAEVTLDQPGIDVRGKRVLIFGGTSGIGKALEDIMTNSGAIVISKSRRNGCDIGVEANVQQSISEATKILGGLDIIVNAAGVLKKGLVKDQSSSDIFNQISINLIGALYIAKWSHAPLKESKGTLLQFASSSYTRGRADYITYSATKAAIVNMTQGLSEEWASDGINVNCLVPGRTDTEMRRENFHNEKQSSLSNPYQIALQAIKLMDKEINGQILRAA
jgi:2-C-methyl-D-erythritol 4-phosphate cytidylyltransferase